MSVLTLYHSKFYAKKQGKRIMLRYRRLTSKTVLDHPRLTAVEDQIELPGGKQGDYLWFDGRQDAVTIIPRNDIGEILIEQEYSYLPDRRLYQFPGGGVEREEEPEAAASRELAEEIHARVSRLTPIGSYLMDHRRSHSLMYVFLGDGLTSCASESEDKYEMDIHSFWMSEADVDALITAGEVVNATLLAAWTLYKSHKWNIL